MQQILEVIELKQSGSRLQFISKKFLEEVAYFLLLIEYFKLRNSKESGIHYTEWKKTKLHCVRCFLLYQLLFRTIWQLFSPYCQPSSPAQRLCEERGFFIGLLNHQITAQCIRCFSMCWWPCPPCSEMSLFSSTGRYCVGAWAVFK